MTLRRKAEAACCTDGDAAATDSCKGAKIACAASPAARDDDALCPLCGGSTKRWWPHIRAPLCTGQGVGNGHTELCHLQCVCDLLEGRGDKGDAIDGGARFSVEAGFAEGLRRVLEMTPQLLVASNPSLRLSYEEQRLNLAASGWPPPEPAAPPRAAFALEGVLEIRISSCAALRTLPPEIGHCRCLKTLVLISNSLTELPPEVGRLHDIEQLFLNGNFLRGLPEAVGALPSLQELCLDSNQVESLPPVSSPKLVLFTAPANRLKALPPLAGRLDRLDVHGNELSMIIPIGSQAQWDRVRNLKLMGNRLTELPEAIGGMRALRTLLVSGNHLKTLPECVTGLNCLEWLFAYQNAIVDLPKGILLGSQWLDRVLLEGNPLSNSAMAALLAEARQSKMKALALDVAQMRSYAASVENWQDAPACVTVGTLVHTEESAQYYMKLVRASQLRRECGGVRAVGEPGGPPTPDEAPAELLVVAFSASQGEPEWLGVLRRLAAPGKQAAALPPLAGSLAAEMGPLAEPGATWDPESQIAALWSRCSPDPAGEAAAQLPSAPAGEDTRAVLPGDFDVLSVIDHRMRWYNEDREAFADALGRVARQHRRVLFVGASMGGFGALLHGGALADAVVAFGPQSRLDHATLRPPAADPEALGTLSAQVRDAVRAARARGASVEVHCAADEHCWHGLNLPLGDLCLTVHPLLPRKPFARLLDRAGILEPILADAVCRLQLRQEAAGAQASPSDRGHSADAPSGLPPDAEPRLIIARWGLQGRFSRNWAMRDEMLKLLFGPGAPYMPRPGDWFCPRCRRRNMSSQFFCYACGIQSEGTRIIDAGASKIPGGREYPRHGDWGCGRCGAAQCNYDRHCSVCWGTRDHMFTVVVA